MKGVAELAGGKPVNCERGFGIMGFDVGMEVGTKLGSEVGVNGLLIGLDGELVFPSSPAECDPDGAWRASFIFGEVFS